MEFLSYFLIPFVTIKKRISVDCGSYPVGGNVESGIHRLLQGIHAQKDETNEYYWFSFHSPSSYHVPRRFYAQVWLPLFTLLHRCDVFLGIGGTIPWLLHFFRLKKILFLHDFGFFTSPDKYSTTAQKLQKQTERSIRWTDRIIVFHEEIYTEFMKRYPSFIYKVELIPAGADHLASISQQPVFVEPARPFILYVGVVKPVKRIEKILSAVGSTYTVIAGPQEQAYKQTLAIGKNQHVQFIKNFNDGQLKWLYQQASVLVYTSEHEGFCYPVLEALSLGLPVIALDLPLFREYKKHFPHLTLAQSTDEMKRELEKINTFKTVTVHHNPYTWSQFALCLKNVMDPQTDINQAHQKTAFIVVLYKTSHEEKKRLAREIESLHVPQYKIYWIDNSTNGKGYAAGVNEGVRAGLRDSCDYFIALNPDISLAVTLGETMLFSAQVFDVWGYTMLQENKAFYGGEIEKWRLSGGLISKKPKTRFAPVDFVSGSLIGFSKQVIQTIGLWDERYFMYYEDVDYCVRARKAGFQVGIDSGIIYRHFELSTHNKKKSEWISRSRWHFFWRNANGLQKIRELIRLPKTILLHS